MSEYFHSSAEYLPYGDRQSGHAGNATSLTPSGLAQTARQAQDQAHQLDSTNLERNGNPFPHGNDIDSSNKQERFIIGLDYGTTFTSVSYMKWQNNMDQANLTSGFGSVKTIKNWPDDLANGSSEQVPTESWYPSASIERPNIEDQFDTPQDTSQRHSSSSSIPFQVGKAEAIYDDMDIDDNGIDSDESLEYLWGYSVAYQRFSAHTTRNPMRRIERAKLMLVNTEYTRNERTDLRRKLNHLISRGIIRKYGKRSEPDIRDIRDVITDFLIKVFQHTKKQLEIFENFTEDCPVEFVVTVPTIWSAEASRVLQNSVESAIDATGLGRLKNDGLENLFLISEPEAAATFLLEQSQAAMLLGETVVILDCGGGTVDGVTYTIDSHYPLRLRDEAVQPGGDNCGGSYVNENFHKHVLHRLRDESYLDRYGETRKALVDYLMRDFEGITKRRYDISKKHIHRERIPGLRGDKAKGPGVIQKGFHDNYLVMDSHDFEVIFRPLLERVGAILRRQVESALKNKKFVKTVFLVGGFAGAPSLISYLKKFVIEISRDFRLPYDIELLEDQKKCVMAVASGAVTRALNKDNGPERHSQSSYGFLRVEPYEPREYPQHLHTTPKEDKLDGDSYVSVINYFMIKGTTIPPIFEFEPVFSIHTFDVDNLPMFCEEVLYVSDSATESHYTLTNMRNRDAQRAGSISTDMSFLRDLGYIKITQPEVNQHGRPVGKPHYRVEYDLVVIIEGRNLRYEARWPSKAVEATASQLALPQTPEVKQRVQLSIAAAFKPGTGDI